MADPITIKQILELTVGEDILEPIALEDEVHITAASLDATTRFIGIDGFDLDHTISYDDIDGLESQVDDQINDGSADSTGGANVFLVDLSTFDTAGDVFTIEYSGEFDQNTLNLITQAGVDYAIEAGAPDIFSNQYFINGGAGNETIIGNAGAATDANGDFLAGDVLRGGGGNDVIDAQSGNDSLFGDAGDDVLIEGRGADAIDGGADIDTLLVSIQDLGEFDYLIDSTEDAAFDYSFNHIFAADDFEVTEFNLVNDIEKIVFDYEGQVTDASLRVNVDADMDIVIQSDNASAVFTVIAGNGNDTIVGGGGEEIIDAGAGNNTVTGGGSADLFRFSGTTNGDTVITDFTIGEDKIDLSALGIAANTFSSILSADESGDVIVNLGGSVDPFARIVLDGVKAADINLDDFVFMEAGNPAPTDDGDDFSSDGEVIGIVGDEVRNGIGALDTFTFAPSNADVNLIKMVEGSFAVQQLVADEAAGTEDLVETDLLFEVEKIKVLAGDTPIKIQGNSDNNIVEVVAAEGVDAASVDYSLDLGAGDDEWVINSLEELTNANVDGGEGFDFINLANLAPDTTTKASFNLAKGKVVFKGESRKDKEKVSFDLPTDKGFEGVGGTRFDDKMKGTKQGDAINGGDGDDKIKGRGGDDTLFSGRDGEDKLIGNGGNDILVSQSSGTLMKGGGGSDTFVFEHNAELGAGDIHTAKIKGFKSKDDAEVIDLTDFGVDLTFEDLTIEKAGRKKALVTFEDPIDGTDYEILLTGVKLGKLDAADFLFDAA